MNEEQSDFRDRLLAVAKQAEALLTTLPPGVHRTRAQFIATEAKLLAARLDVAAPLILGPAQSAPLKHTP